MLNRQRLHVFYVKSYFTLHQCLRVLKTSGLFEVAFEEWLCWRCVCHYSASILEKTANDKTKKKDSRNLLPYSQHPITALDSVPAESNQHPHTRFPLAQCNYSINTHSTNVFKDTHYSSRLTVPHALSFTSLYFINLNVKKWRQSSSNSLQHLVTCSKQLKKTR